MKRIILFGAILLTALSFSDSKAQVRVNVNIGTPVYVHREPVREVSYYYMPEQDAYYSVRERRYYYEDGGTWISASYLPRYRDCDVYRVRHVAVYEPRPYLKHDYYRSRYAVKSYRHSGPDRHERGWGDRGHGHGRGRGHH